jgi:hypothetical protein
MINQLKQQEIINTLSSLTDEQIEILNQFIKSFIAQPNNLQTQEEFIDENQYLISDVLIKEWSKPEEEKAWQNL